jgi:hypothetical protein
MSDVNGGQYPNPNGSPIFPGTTFTGPLLAGNVIHSDGSGTLAGLGETNVGTANVGYAHMTQAQAGVTQAASAGQSAGVFVTSIVIPAQSAITSIKLRVTTAFSGTATTLGIGTTASATALTAANAVVTSGALGDVTITPGTGATQIGNWDNVGNSDVQIVLTSTNTGNGVATLFVEYMQGINLAS